MKEDLILTKESSPAKIREYYQLCLYMMRQGASRPVGLDEVWQLVFETYEEAEEELKYDYIEDIDYHYSSRNKKYSMTITCAEGLVFRKKAGLKFIYHEVFYSTIYEQTKIIRQSYKSLSKEYKALRVKYEKALAKVETARSRRDEVKKAADKVKKKNAKESLKMLRSIEAIELGLKQAIKAAKDIRKYAATGEGVSEDIVNEENANNEGGLL